VDRLTATTATDNLSPQTDRRRTTVLPEHELNWQTATSADVVTRSLLIRNAREKPEEPFVIFENGDVWTRQRALDEACSAANELTAMGIGRGDRVTLLLPNGPDLLRSWWGAAMLGAVTFPMNTAFIGTTLERAIRVGAPSLLVVGSEFEQRVTDVSALGALRRIQPTDLAGGTTTVPELQSEVEFWETQLLVMTSGTSGPSKLAEISSLHPFVGWTAIPLREGFGEDDTHLIDLPLFHMGALGYVTSSLVTRTRIHVRTRPPLDSYWEVARDFDVTAGILISAMVPMLENQPSRPAEREHRLKNLLMAPLPVDVDAFRKRFNVPKIVVAYGSTEASSPIQGEGRAGLAPGYCGQLRNGWEMKIVDEHDQDLPVGTAGEAIFRAARPFMMSSGYYANPEATAAAWRHGWFHTGDLMKADAEGNIYFVDRTKDALRRRGENISAYEVEIAVAAFPGVAEVACVPVPSDLGVDDDVKVWIVPAAGVAFDLAKLLKFCVASMPHYMVPRYFELVGDLPKTPSAKVQKYLLRERGNTAATWDIQAAGYRVTRRGLEWASADR
jgi:crotonobetaine/carnitine-CoA ligase